MGKRQVTYRDVLGDLDDGQHVLVYVVPRLNAQCGERLLALGLPNSPQWVTGTFSVETTMTTTLTLDGDDHKLPVTRVYRRPGNASGEGFYKCARFSYVNRIEPFPSNNDAEKGEK